MPNEFKIEYYLYILIRKKVFNDLKNYFWIWHKLCIRQKFVFTKWEKKINIDELSFLIEFGGVLILISRHLFILSTGGGDQSSADLMLPKIDQIVL
jgi:hypothetical protein